MTNPIVLKVRAQITVGAIPEAVSELERYVETAGDNALIQILDEFPPNDLIAIVREYDGGKDSVVNLAISAESFVSAIMLEHLYGEDRWDYVSRLRNLMNGVMYRDEDMLGNVLRILSEHPDGLRILRDYFDGRYEQLMTFAQEGTFLPTAGASIEAIESGDHLERERLVALDSASFPESFLGEEAFSPKISRAEISDGDWMETAWVIAHEHPRTFASLLGFMRRSMISQLQRQFQAEEQALAEEYKDYESEQRPASKDDDESAI